MTALAIVSLTSSTPLGLKVGNKLVLERVLEILGQLPNIEKIVVASPNSLPREWVREGVPIEVLTATSRLAAIEQALKLARSAPLVLLHDADRPLTTPELLRTILAKATEVGGVACGAPVKSACKEVRDEVIRRSIARNNLIQMVGVSAFRRDTLEAALKHAEAHPEHSDDEVRASVAAGIPILLRRLTAPCFRVDTPEAARVAERLNE